MQAQRAYAHLRGARMRARRHAICKGAARGAGTRFSSMIALSSGQAWAKYIRRVTRDREARARPGGARVRGARGADFARGREARGAGQRPPAPLPTLIAP